MTDADIFVLEDGDGDPSFLHMKHKVRVVAQPRFPTEIHGQPAILLEVVSGPHEGRFVALTSRVLQPIDRQMSERGFASVVVRLVANPVETFDERADLGIGGMTVLRRIDDNRFGA